MPNNTNKPDLSLRSIVINSSGAFAAVLLTSIEHKKDTLFDAKQNNLSTADIESRFKFLGNLKLSEIAFENTY